MADIEQYKQALIKAHNAGDTAAANLFASKIKEQSQETTIGEDIVGGLETAATIASGAIAEPISGLFGAYEQFKGGDPKALIPFMQKELTYEPRTEAGKQQIQSVGEFLQPVGEAFKGIEEGLGNAVFDATGNATLAAMAHTLPTAALEALGVKGLMSGKKPSMSPEEIQHRKDFTSKGFEPKQFDRNKLFSDSQKKEQLNKVLASGNQEQLAAMIDADPDFFKALEELGAKEKGLPSAASKNRQYQETEPPADINPEKLTERLPVPSCFINN